MLRYLGAGMVAFLQLTELPWVYAIDVLLLDEPTSLLAGLGSAVVFVSALAAFLDLDAASAALLSERFQRIRWAAQHRAMDATALDALRTHPACFEPT